MVRVDKSVHPENLQILAVCPNSASQQSMKSAKAETRASPRLRSDASPDAKTSPSLQATQRRDPEHSTQHHPGPQTTHPDRTHSRSSSLYGKILVKVEIVQNEFSKHDVIKPGTNSRMVRKTQYSAVKQQIILRPQEKCKIN